MEKNIRPTFNKEGNFLAIVDGKEKYFDTYREASVFWERHEKKMEVK